MESENTPNKDASQAPPITFTSPSPRKPKRSLKPALLVLLILALAGGGAAAYWMRDRDAKSQAKKQADEIALLKTQLSASELTDETTDETETKKDEKSATDNADNIADAVSSGNTAALKGYMADKVRVIIAASEGVGDVTPDEAISELKYVEDATDPWDFDLPAATLNEYAAGSYGQYFPIGAVVGKSADDKVVSFTFDAAGDINGIFMAINADLLSD